MVGFPTPSSPIHWPTIIWQVIEGPHNANLINHALIHKAIPNGQNKGC